MFGFNVAGLLTVDIVAFRNRDSVAAGAKSYGPASGVHHFCGTY